MTFKNQDKWPFFLKVAERFKLTRFEKIILLALYEHGINQTLSFLNTEDHANSVAKIIKINTQQYNKLMTQGTLKTRKREIVIGNGQDEEWLAYVSPDLDFISFLGSYSTKTGYGFVPIDSPEMKKEERRHNMHWIPNMQETVKKIQNHFNQKPPAIQTNALPKQALPGK